MRKITYGKLRFKQKMVTGDKESQYIVVKGLIHPADTTVINVVGCYMQPTLEHLDLLSNY